VRRRRLALETGAPVAPIAVIGTEHVRRGWRIRPRKVRLRVGRPLRFPTVLEEEPSPKLAAGMTRRIWVCVSLQWEWLGGESDRAPDDRQREERSSTRAHEPERVVSSARAA
jgi:1-acyl-sn-glycerol-3-phosphate acyltransferase